MIRQIIRRLKIESLARRLDPKAFVDRRSFAKRQARERAEKTFAASEGQYDAIGGSPGD